MEIYTTDEFEKLLGPPPADTPASAQTTLAEAKLLLRVDGEGYLIEDDALTIH